MPGGGFHFLKKGKLGNGWRFFCIRIGVSFGYVGFKIKHVLG